MDVHIGWPATMRQCVFRSDSRVTFTVMDVSRQGRTGKPGCEQQATTAPEKNPLDYLWILTSSYPKYILSDVGGPQGDRPTPAQGRLRFQGLPFSS